MKKSLIMVLFFFIFLNINAIKAEEILSPKEIYHQNQEAVGIVIVADENNKPISQGSGFFITNEGAFVTNLHVLENAEYIYIKLQNGAMFIPVTYIGCDENADIIILKVDGKNLPCLQLGNSHEIEIGEEVLTIGSPRGLENSLSTGIVSAIREFKDGGLRFIQTTAEVSPGNSGCPLFNMEGKVVGVTTFIVGQGEALTFAVPIEYVKNIMEQQKPRNINEQVDLENSPEYYYFAGIVARDAENYDAAKEYFYKAIALNERFDKPYYELGDIYYKQKMFKEEKIVSEKLVGLRPMDAEPHYNYALALENNGEEIEAIRQYKIALKFEPNHQDSLYNVGFLYILHENYSEAQEIIQRLRSVNTRWANQLDRLFKKLTDKNGGEE